eukprot:479320_1
MQSIQAEIIQGLNDNIIQDSLISTDKLMNLTDQWKPGAWFFGNDVNIMVEYPLHGNRANNSSSNGSRDSDKKNPNNNQKENNSNYHNNNNSNQNNDDHDRNDKNDDEKGTNECNIHKYNCNKLWHAVRLKELEDENKALRLLVKQLTKLNESELNEDIKSNDSELKENQLLNEQTNIKMTKKLILQEIPNKVKESFCNVSFYMNKYTQIYHDTATKEYKHEKQTIKVINYDIHCNKTQRPLFVVCESIQSKDQANNVHISWKTNDILYTAFQLEEMYKIPFNNLPLSGSKNKEAMVEMEKIKEQVMHMLQDPKQRNDIITAKKTKWNHTDKVPVYNKTSKKYGLRLKLTKEEFVTKLKKFGDENCDNIHLIPIVNFNKNDYFVEIVWVVQIGKD